MAEVDAHVVRWTPWGMRPATCTVGGYVAVREVERLLEEAHARGRQEARSDYLTDERIREGMHELRRRGEL